MRKKFVLKKVFIKIILEMELIMNQVIVKKPLILGIYTVLKLIKSCSNFKIKQIILYECKYATKGWFLFEKFKTKFEYLRLIIRTPLQIEYFIVHTCSVAKLGMRQKLFHYCAVLSMKQRYFL